VEWSIDLGITAQELVTLIQEGITGTLDDSDIDTEWEPGVHLGHERGLSPRESSVLKLVVNGRSNQEIAEDQTCPSTRSRPKSGRPTERSAPPAICGDDQGFSCGG
jgi:FixJ family two-component response regulator